MSLLQKWEDRILKALGVESSPVDGAPAQGAPLELGYDFTKLEPLPMASHIPLGHLPTLGWWRDLAAGIETIVKNARYVANTSVPPELASMLGAIEDGDELAATVVRDVADLPAILKAILDLQHVGGDGGSGPKAVSVADYGKILSAIRRPEGALQPIERDDDFARMTVEGPNPMLLARVSVHTELFLGPDLYGRAEGLVHVGRLYVCDYRIFETVPAGTCPSAQKMVLGPVAYFVRDDLGRLAPFCISLANDGSPRRTISMTPEDGAKWRAFKAIVVAADLTMHETVSHLGRTHLFIEPVVVATDRKLPVSHPVHRLLRPHFDGTLFINDLASKILVTQGGAVNQLAGPTIDATRTMVTTSLLKQPFSLHEPARDFAQRDVLESSGPLDYPYRDDALLLWTAIHNWCTSYVDLFYADDLSVKGDVSLQGWAEELLAVCAAWKSLASGKASLVTTLATVIFTASVQHAAVNFPQAEMVDVANWPLSVYGAWQDLQAIIQSENPKNDAFLSLLPPLDQALRQANLLSLLSSVRRERLGTYDEGWFQENVAPALKAFQDELAQIEATIEKRNDARRPYTYLLPSSIPRSINI